MPLHITDTLEQVAVSFSGTNDNLVIAAPGVGKHIAIDFLMFLPSADVSLTIYNGTHAAGTAISGVLPFKANQPIIVENTIQNPEGIITCGDNQAFNLYSTGSSTITGMCRYRIIGK